MVATGLAAKHGCLVKATDSDQFGSPTLFGWKDAVLPLGPPGSCPSLPFLFGWEGAPSPFFFLGGGSPTTID